MCDCIERVNNQLEKSGKNTVLDIPVLWTRDGAKIDLSNNRVRIATIKRDASKRQKAIPVTGVYCPFCGKEYEVKEKTNE